MGDRGERAGRAGGGHAVLPNSRLLSLALSLRASPSLSPPNEQARRRRPGRHPGRRPPPPVRARRPEPAGLRARGPLARVGAHPLFRRRGRRHRGRVGVGRCEWCLYPTGVGAWRVWRSSTRCVGRGRRRRPRARRERRAACLSLLPTATSPPPTLPTLTSKLPPSLHPPPPLSGKAKARLSTLERAIVTWLVVTATVHLIVEGESVACVARVGVLRPRGWRGRVERERRESV